MSEVVPAPDDRRAFLVVNGRTEQSWVDPNDPLRLEFEYVQRIAEALEETVLARPGDEHVRLIHIGGGGLTLPRYVEARRPRTRQVVLEPDEALTEQVRRRLPLPRNSGIRIRPVDGRTGIAAFAADTADAIIVDAFAGASVPAELASQEFHAELRRVLAPDGVALFNLTDSAPFNWSRRHLAGVASVFRKVVVSAEIPVWKGRRFGNLVALAGELRVPALERRLRTAPIPYRLREGRELRDWIGGAQPFTDADAEPSPEPPWSKRWYT